MILILKKEKIILSKKIITIFLFLLITSLILLFFYLEITFTIFIIVYLIIIFFISFYIQIKVFKYTKIEVQKEKQRLKIEEIKSFYKNNTSYYLHKIKNKLLPLKLLIRTAEIEPDLKEDIQNYIKQIQGTINEFYQLDELYKKQSFILKDFTNSFELFHKAELKQNKIKFEFVYKKISPETLINIPFHTFHSINEILFDNSFEAFKNVTRKEIAVFISQKDSILIIEFCDTGVGIDKKTQEKIFKTKFTTKKEGKGIGLLHVKTIIDNLNGKITLKNSNEEFKTIFEVQIPLRDKINKKI